jgi:hypothetical protein
VVGVGEAKRQGTLNVLKMQPSGQDRVGGDPALQAAREARQRASEVLVLCL